MAWTSGQVASPFWVADLETVISNYKKKKSGKKTWEKQIIGSLKGK